MQSAFIVRIWKRKGICAPSLTRINPYTDKTYAEDQFGAVEINNGDDHSHMARANWMQCREFLQMT